MSRPKRCPATGKVQYPDRQAAEEAVQEIKDRVVYINDVGPKGRLHSYQCGYCGKWHVGHSRWAAP